MRAFILICLMGFSLAAPQGYNYAAHQPHLQYGGVPEHTTSLLKDLQAVMAVQSANIEPNFALSQPQISNELFSGSAITAPGAQTHISTGSGLVTQPQARYLAPAVFSANGLQSSSTGLQLSSKHIAGPVETVVSKRFFIHSAPEEEEEPIEHRSITIGQARKNYNVVFIRAPAKSASKTSLKITPATNEEKTVIYVLDKKANADEIDAQVLEPASTTAKPEVFFIKYKTNEEAAHAQQTIQAQYDSLGGSTHILNEGISPVTSVIGSLDADKNAVEAPQTSQELQYEQEILTTGPQQQQIFQTITSNAGNAYLPPAKYKL